ncbi:MAG TPA: very short patch repair endonuclease [Candidatus Heimdallarchaeota archaeon]|nr:very short patch repair endonuclease [Candidatus Heimdallarchaeota archaeon]
MDKISKERRSWNMSRIRAKNTKPEVFVRSMLHRMGYRFRIHLKGLPGKPDIVLPKYHTAIFVHGCFWHGHEGCKDFAPPKTRTEWWLNKINGNKKKDTENIAQLDRQGWHVIIIWECELTPDKRENTIKSLVDMLNNKI